MMSDEQWELVTDGEYVPQPMMDQSRSRYIDENGEWTEWGDWLSVQDRDSINGWRLQSLLRQYEFRRPRQSAEAASAQPQPQPQDDWELITDPNHVLRIGIDQKRWRMWSGESGKWTEWTAWESAHSVIRVGDLPTDNTQWQCRKPKQQPDPQQPAPSAGSKYKRTIRQTLPDGRPGASVVVDIYDVLRAWNVTCPAIQHAVKKLLQPGQRGSKSAAQDLREAIGSIERAIQLMGDGGPVSENFQNSADSV